MCTDQQSTALTESPAEFAELSLRNPPGREGEVESPVENYIRADTNVEYEYLDK